MRPQSRKYNIICLSNQLWDYPLWTNKRHVMGRLAEKGHSVLFVDPFLNIGRVFLKHVFKKEWTLRRLATRIKKDFGVTIYTPLNAIPFGYKATELYIKKINKISENIFDSSRKTLLWIYNVEITDIEKYIKGIKHDFLIYDCVDNYSAFPRYDTADKKRKISTQEKYLAEKADAVFASAPGLVEKMRKFNPRTFYTPNVGDYERFKNTLSYKNQIPEEIKRIPEPRIGFTGAVDEYKFDTGLLKKVASDYPGYSFIIIGPMALKEREASKKALGVEDLNNVYYFDSRPYDQMVKYTAGFDVCIIPYQINEYTVGGCFPVKFHEQLAAGIPVVVTDLPAYAPFYDVCYISKSHNEFSQNIRRALQENSPEKVKERQKIAKENTWDGKVNNMIKIINSLI